MEHAGQIIAVILIMAAVGFVVWWLEKQRRETIRAWAQSQGYRFRAGRDSELARRYPDFKVLHRGRNRFAKHVVSGEVEGRSFEAFDYQYTTGHGKNRRTHRLSAIVLRSPHLLIPLRIRREHLFDRIGEFLGFDDIDFESAEFSRKFHVSSPDRKWAFDVLHNRTIEYLLRECFANLEFDGWHVIVYRGNRFNPAEFERALSLASGILDRIPDYAVRELTGSERPVEADVDT
jgi:hypothetical protein